MIQVPADKSSETILVDSNKAAFGVNGRVAGEGLKSEANHRKTSVKQGF
jgi:hypothetical protein